MPRNVAQKLIADHLVEGGADPGQEIGLRVDQTLTQDATGGRTVTWGSRYAGLGAINTAPGKTTLWTFRCIEGKWVQVAYAAL